MAVRSRGVKKEYVQELNLEGVATQKEMDDAFAEHIENDHTEEGLLPAPEEENMILKSYVNDDDEIKWKVVKADDPQEGLTVIALPYYWDEDREKYLDNQVIRVVMYKDGNADDEWIYYIPNIRSDRVPYKLFPGETMCIVGYELSMSDTASGEVIEIRNITGYEEGVFGSKTAEYDVLYTIDLGDDEVDTQIDMTLNIDADPDYMLSAYALADADLDDPVMTILLRKVWEVEDDS